MVEEGTKCNIEVQTYILIYSSTIKSQNGIKRIRTPIKPKPIDLIPPVYRKKIENVS